MCAWASARRPCATIGSLRPCSAPNLTLSRSWPPSSCLTGCDATLKMSEEKPMITDTSNAQPSDLAVGLRGVQVDPQQLIVGQAASPKGTITLTAEAPAGGADVEVFTDQPEVVSVPEVVHV